MAHTAEDCALWGMRACSWTQASVTALARELGVVQGARKKDVWLLGWGIRGAPGAGRRLSAAERGLGMGRRGGARRGRHRQRPGQDGLRGLRGGERWPGRSMAGTLPRDCRDAPPGLVRGARRVLGLRSLSAVGCGSGDSGRVSTLEASTCWAPVSRSGVEGSPDGPGIGLLIGWVEGQAWQGLDELLPIYVFSCR